MVTTLGLIYLKKKKKLLWNELNKKLSQNILCFLVSINKSLIKENT